ncbi:DUF445 family protein [Sulfurimonas sp. MAG313]|nr:DUF445 family protein [Sulfurimonas sp. MAG313]MDF1880242.1 DUF445 family protein [Sulfurimonas sp. MAG313]
MNKSYSTNLIAILITISAYFLSEPYHTPIFYIGLFALSGAITNALAVHMLFEKVPFLYGSGVVAQNFESFKMSIKDLMMNEFFTPENMKKFLEQEEKTLDLEPVIDKTDFSPAFDALSKTVMESSFGSMLGMLGGEKAIESLREPFEKKMKAAVKAIASSDDFQNNLNESLAGSDLSLDLNTKIETAINSRMDELDATMVKEMVQKIISEHLGWLVVWGGVLGGLIGLISSSLL